MNRRLNKMKSLHEDGRAFSQRFRMTKNDFEAWQKATSKDGLAYVRDIDGVKACYVNSFDKNYKRNMPKHIGTWNPETEELTCDDVSLFGHEVTESVSNQLTRIFETGKIEGKSQVVVNFEGSGEAKGFKEGNYSIDYVPEEKNTKGKRVAEDGAGFKPLRELLDSLVGPEEYADFLEYASGYGYDFEYEDPNAVWSVAEIQELVDCYRSDEDFDDYFGDTELYVECDSETGEINLAMAYAEWVQQFASNYDVSDRDAWQAGVELAGGVCDQASWQKYVEWCEAFPFLCDVANVDTFVAGFKSITEDPDITCFESATPYKSRGVTYERRSRC